MDYTHKFTSGPLRMENVIENYFSLRKARGKCLRCEKYNKYWSCPEFGFSEKVLLEQFQYLYVIGREYAVPKEHKQTITGVVRTKNYIDEVRERMNTEGWRDLLEIEKDYPNAMILRPGNCNICEAAGIKCAKKSHDRCRHSELMRFSIESLGLDADSIAKFEVGMLLNWPTDSHLPEKISCLMGVLTNEKIPMAQLKSYFPDVKKSYLKAGQTILGGEDAPKAKRVDSWLEHQAEELREKEEAEGDHGSWLGFKDQSLDSGDFVKNRAWAQNDSEYPDAPPDLGDRLEGDQVAAPKVSPQAPPDVAPKPMPNEAAADQGGDGDPKYKWLGFKRSVEEADEMMRERPIPKFNISPEEKAAQDAQIQAQMHPEAYSTAQAYPQQPQQQYAPQPDSGNVGAGQNVQFENTGASANVNADKYAGIRDALAQTIRTAMPDATDADVAKLLDATLKTAQAKRERKEHLAPGSQGATVLSNPPGRDPVKEPPAPEPPKQQAPPQPQMQPQQPPIQQQTPQPQQQYAPQPVYPVYPDYQENAQPIYQAPQDPYVPPEQPQATQQQEMIRRPQAQPMHHDSRRRAARPAQKRKVRRVRRVVKPQPQARPQQQQAAAPKAKSGDPLAAALAIAQAVVDGPGDAAPEIEVQTADQYDVPQDDGSYVVEEIEEYYDDGDSYQDYDAGYDDGYDSGYQADEAYQREDYDNAPREASESVDTAPAEPIDPNDLKGDDDTRYKWLGFKADIGDGDDNMPKGSWRDRKQY